MLNGFVLAKVNLHRPACPRELEAQTLNLDPRAPLIVARNVSRIGSIAGYVPTAVLVSGAARRKALWGRGILASWAWVEDGALETADQVTASELLDKIDAAVRQKFFNSRTPIKGQQWPYILGVYPMENCCIYAYGGAKYRQPYELDAVTKDVHLVQGAVQVFGQGLPGDAHNNEGPMPRVQTGVRYVYAPIVPRSAVPSYGAKNSELVTQVVRNWTNILGAVAAYLSAIKNGQHTPMRPSFSPVALTEKGTIVASLAENGVDACSFARWSCEAQEKKTKRVAGEDLGPGAFAYVGAKDDPSTWHLPIKFKDAAKSKSHTQNALSRVNQVQGIPESAKSGVMAKLHKHAKHHGIDVSEKATPKQKHWLHSQLA